MTYTSRTRPKTPYSSSPPGLENPGRAPDEPRRAPSRATRGRERSGERALHAGRMLAPCGGASTRRSAAGGLAPSLPLLSNENVTIWAFARAWVRFVIGPRPEVVVALDWTEFDADGKDTRCEPNGPDCGARALAFIGGELTCGALRPRGPSVWKAQMTKRDAPRGAPPGSVAATSALSARKPPPTPRPPAASAPWCSAPAARRGRGWRGRSRRGGWLCG